MAGACQGLLEGSHHQSPRRAVRRWNPMYSTQCEWIREWTLLREAATNTSDDKKGWFFFNINILLQRGPCQLTGLAACMSKCHPDLSCCLLRADARSLNQSQASHKRCGVDNVYTIERPAGCLWYERGKIVKKKNVLSVKTSAQTQHGDKAQTRFQSRNFGFSKWRRWTLHTIVHSLIFFLGVPYLWEVI